MKLFEREGFWDGCSGEFFDFFLVVRRELEIFIFGWSVVVSIRSMLGRRGLWIRGSVGVVIEVILGGEIILENVSVD